MPDSKVEKAADSTPLNSPLLRRGQQGSVDPASMADALQWFLDHDPRVAIIRHPRVEELFQWKQEESRREGEDVYMFPRAEDRLAIGIMQALVENSGERELHAWISQLLNALEDASKTNEEMAAAYKLSMGSEDSVIDEAMKIPTERGRSLFLVCCWLETLCTAEIRVLGWFYQELYGRPFHPNNYL
jgi:hypothetical protein